MTTFRRLSWMIMAAIGLSLSASPGHAQQQNDPGDQPGLVADDSYELDPEWQKQVAGDSTNAPLRVVELLAANPFITAKSATEKLEVAFTTAQRAIERLERLKIVKQVGEAKRGRVYCAEALLEILEEPAQLRPAN